MTTLMYCYNCKEHGRDTYHFNEDGPCPRCNAGAYSQCFHPDTDEFYDIPDNHPDLLTARREYRIREVKSVLSGQPLEILLIAQELINKKIAEHPQVTHISINKEDNK